MTTSPLSFKGRVKILALTALREGGNPFKFIEDVARQYGVKIEMIVSLESNVWRVDLECDTDIPYEEFSKIFGPLERRGFVADFRHQTTRRRVPLNIARGWGEQDILNFIYVIRLVFPGRIKPPDRRPDSIVRYEVRFL